MITAKLVSIEHLTPNVTTFWFEPERPVRFDAGQYVDLFVPHAAPDNRGLVRTMSLSSSPHQPLLGITTQFPSGSKQTSTFKQALRALQSGNTVKITEPMGDCVLPKNPNVPLVFIAGGIGITPVHSMIRWLDHKNEPRTMQLIYIAKSPNHILNRPLLEQHKNLRIDYFYTQKPAADQSITPRVTTKQILQAMNGTDNKLIYLSGPRPMTETYWNELQAAGIPREQLILDYFTGYTHL